MNFQHIYIESQAKQHPLSLEILEKFPQATLIEIDNYKQFFNRPNQNFMAQRKNMKLILAKQESNFLHEGSDRVRSFGDAHIYSCSMIRNCVYHCEYCFLSGMHESSNIVIYVNIEDFEQELHRIAENLSPEPIYFISSYLTDLPTFEPIFAISEKWINITEKIDNVDIEVRTKGNTFGLLRHIGAKKHVVFSISISPQNIVKKYEHATAPMQSRILQAYQAIQDGWRVRLCFDPILFYEGWEQDYRTCIEQCASRIDVKKIEKLSYGVFRMSTGFLQKMRQTRPGAKILHNNIVLKNGLGSYNSETITHMRKLFENMLLQYFPKEKINFVHG